MKKLIAVCLLAGLVALAGCNSSQTASASYIGVEAARSAALKDAGETEGDFTNATLEERDGTVYYDVEFTAGGAKYEYAVDALTGSIIEAKKEGGESQSSSSQPSSSSSSSSQASSQSSSSLNSTPKAESSRASGTTGLITEEEAANIAKEHAQVTDCTMLPVKLDRDDGRQVYDVEFFTADGKEYDYEIDAATGEVLSYDYDAERQAATASGTASITEAEAKSLVLAQVPGAAEENFLEFKTDYDDGRLEYEGELFYDGMKYEFTVDGYSGTIREWESEKTVR
ncbi:MAG TPA: PepSY domain-containing protein [Candidatus Acutalibacter stercorigallinarum]|nr:PepSY domain-containing protein [Candidatus Acutalibacter stercorigallinarum]